MRITFDDNVQIRANYFEYDDHNHFFNQLVEMDKVELKIFTLITFLGRHKDSMDKENHYSHAGTVTISINEIVTLSKSLRISKPQATKATLKLIKKGLITQVAIFEEIG
jgi:DNA-binding MarR family transcriptional regulator